MRRYFSLRPDRRSDDYSQSMAIADRVGNCEEPSATQIRLGSGDSIRWLAAVFAIFVTMQPFTGGPLGASTRFAAFACAGISLLVLGTRPLQTAQMMKTMHLRAVFVLPLLSVLWSVNRSATETAALSFIGATGIALLIIQEVPPDRAISAIVTAAGAALLLSLLSPFAPVLLADDSLGVSGIFEHKNALGRAAIVLALASLVGWSLRAHGRTRPTGVALAFATFIGIWSGSGTSAVTVGATIAIFFALLLGRQRLFRDPRLLYGTLIVALSALPASAMFAEPIEVYESILSALGREVDNNTLFVRLSLWEATLSEIAKRPVWGFGYGTFDFENVTVSTGRRTVVWEAQQPHNGVLDVAYQLGGLGLVIISLHFGAVWRSVARAVRFRTVGPYLIVLSMANITYSVLYGTLAIFWVVHIVVIWAAIEHSRMQADRVLH